MAIGTSNTTELDGDSGDAVLLHEMSETIWTIADEN